MARTLYYLSAGQGRAAMQTEARRPPGDHHHPRVQQTRRQEACGKHLCGLVVSTEKSLRKDLLDLLTQEDGSFFILFPGKTCSSYSGGEGLFPFPFPIHLVSIFLQRYCCE